VQYTQHEAAAPDGLRLHLHAWRADGDYQASAALAAVHGHGVHGARFQRMAEYLVPRGVAVYALDLRGHGRSEGARGRIRRIHDYLGDVAALLAFAREDAPGQPLFLLGHSVGGLITLRYALEHALAAQFAAPRPTGVVAAAPFLRRAFPAPAWKLILAPIVSMILPNFASGNEIDPAKLSADPTVLTDHQADPLVHDIISARLHMELLAAQVAVRANASRFNLPLLLLHGDADFLAAPDATRELYASANHALCRYQTYPDAQHELFTEEGNVVVFRDIEAWLREVISSQ
jgi:alpha-beta hydrolase superfamily lysophospholipase